MISQIIDYDIEKDESNRCYECCNYIKSIDYAHLCWSKVMPIFFLVIFFGMFISGFIIMLYYKIK